MAISKQILYLSSFSHYHIIWQVCSFLWQITYTFQKVVMHGRSVVRGECSNIFTGIKEACKAMRCSWDKEWCRWEWIAFWASLWHILIRIMTPPSSQSPLHFNVVYNGICMMHLKLGEGDNLFLRHRWMSWQMCQKHWCIKCVYVYISIQLEAYRCCKW